MSIRALNKPGNYMKGNVICRYQNENIKWDVRFFNEASFSICPMICRRRVEEKRKWRHRQDEDNDGESNATTAAKKSSPTTVKISDIQNSKSLSRKLLSPAAIGGGGIDKGQKQPVPNYFVMLASSPPRISSDNDDESDTSTYDLSYHNRETDICQDSTDYDSSSGDSYTTDGLAQVDIVEYEVASISSDDDSLISSSGTDEHGLIMAAVTALDTTTSSSDFADREESDSDKLFDRELTEADFWQCIQCKNTQNNPLYRMCEKCYKIRRTHFPPRPKFRKRKLNRLRKTASSPPQRPASNPASKRNYQDSSLSGTDASTINGGDKITKRLTSDVIGNDALKASFQSYKNNSYKKCKLNYSNSSQLNSAAETSDDASSDVDHRTSDFSMGHRKRKSPLRFRREILSTKQSSSGQSSLSVNSFENRLSNKRKSSMSPVLLHDSSPKQSCKPDMRRRLSQIETASESDDSHTLITDSQKDSGISSAQSSQEPPSSLSGERFVDKDELIKSCNQETVGKSVLLKNIINLESNQSIVPARLTGTTSNLTLGNQFSDPDRSNLIRSVSDCSNTLLNNNFAAESFTLNMGNLVSDFSRYGSCIICLSEPKNGVFVHSNSLHLCSCYKCAVKHWNKNKRCAVCNKRAMNILQLYVH